MVPKHASRTSFSTKNKPMHFFHWFWAACLLTCQPIANHPAKRLKLCKNGPQINILRHGWAAILWKDLQADDDRFMPSCPVCQVALSQPIGQRPFRPHLQQTPCLLHTHSMILKRTTCIISTYFREWLVKILSLLRTKSPFLLQPFLKVYITITGKFTY